MIEARWPSTTSGIEGAVHVDGSTRPLVVSDSSHPFWPLLHEARDRIGIGAAINTSFNADGEPMVHDPVDALRTLASTDLDFVAFENLLLVKPGDRSTSSAELYSA